MHRYYEEWKNLTHKKDLHGKQALMTVKKHGHLLKYVKDQTEEICLAAVKEHEFALQYVEEKFFASK
jgi:hypothetical protein